MAQLVPNLSESGGGKVAQIPLKPISILFDAIACLTISNNGITIDKCNLNNNKQQWEISPDENKCYLT